MTQTTEAGKGDLRTSDTQWICGHVAGAMCAECYRALAQAATELATSDGEKLNEAAAFLDGLAARFDDALFSRQLDGAAADCRAMAKKLRGEV